MALRYIIRYEWPSGKVRFLDGQRLCIDPEDATVLSLHEASREIRGAKDAKLIWGIIATKVKV